MRIDDIALFFGKHEIALGILQGKAMMLKSVPTKALVGIVPIIQIVIVQQRAAHQCAHVTGYPRSHRHSVRRIGDLDAMLIHGNIRVRDPLLHLIIARLANYLLGDLKPIALAASAALVLPDLIAIAAPNV